jgi:hypothetical protein
MQTLLGFLVFIVLLASGLWALQAGGSIPQATIALLSAGVGYSVWRSQQKAREASDLEAKLVIDKRALYKIYLDLLRDFLRGEKLDDAKSKALVTEMRRFVFGAMLNASDDVLLAHNRFMRATSTSPDIVLPAVADVIFAMRQDIAGGQSKVAPIAILATFVNDISNYREIFDRWERQKSMWTKGRDQIVNPRLELVKAG